MSRLDLLKILKDLNELEKDILDFYKWLLLDKEFNNDLSCNSFNSIIVIATKIINKHNVSFEVVKKQAMNIGLVSHYIFLNKNFDINSFRNKYFTIDEIRLLGNRWYLPEIDKLI